MYRTIAFSLLFLSIFSVASAQKKFKHHELLGGYGYESYQRTANKGKPINGSLSWGVPTYADATSTGAISIGYRYHVNSKLAFAIVLIHEKMSGELDGLTTQHSKWNSTSTAFMWEAVYSYFKRPGIKVYCLGGIGRVKASRVTEIYEGNDLRWRSTDAMKDLSWQLTPVGIRAGKMLGVYLEAGYGYKGIVNCGLSLRL